MAVKSKNPDFVSHVIEYDYLDVDGKLKKGKFNYFESVNSHIRQVRRSLESQVEQVLLGLKGDEKK